MAHYAYLDENNIVTQVVVGKDETEPTPPGFDSWEQYYGAIRTSYNGNIRFNFASIGYSYDPIDDAFIAPMPNCNHSELILNINKRWECANDDHSKQIS
jgi:hypothetical protein